MISVNDIPKGWMETTLGEIADTNPDYISRNYPYEKIFYLDTGSITKGEIQSLQVYNLKEAPSRAKRLVQNKDIVYSTVRPNQEHYGFISEPKKNMVISTGFAVIRAHSIDEKLLYYYLTQPSVTNYLHTLAEHSTSAYPSIKPIDLENLSFIISKNIEEQKAIAKILTAFDDKIENLQAQNKTLEQTAQTIFAAWFGKYQVGDELPDGWRVGKLGEEFKITMGQSPSGSSYNEEGNGTVFFQGRAEFTSRFPDIRLYTTEPKRMANKFDVLVSVRAPVGDINVAHINCCIGRGLAAVSSKYKSYALYKLRSIKPVFDLFESEGTVFGSINKTSFENIETIIPPSVKVLEFDILSEKIDAKIYNNHNQIQSLKKTRDTLLPKLMSGQIRVNEFKA